MQSVINVEAVVFHCTVICVMEITGHFCLVLTGFLSTGSYA